MIEAATPLESSVKENYFGLIINTTFFVLVFMSNILKLWNQNSYFNINIES